MKATINSNGTMIIKPENELEMYAVKKWSKDNTNSHPEIIVNIEIDMSDDPCFITIKDASPDAEKLMKILDNMDNTGQKEDVITMQLSRADINYINGRGYAVEHRERNSVIYRLI